jgi:hypothetical protein
MSGNQHTIADEGDTVTLTVTWRNASGTLTTPSTNTYAVRTPAQTEAGATAAVTTGWTTASTGIQTRTVLLNVAGLWRIECRGAGNGVDDVQVFTYDVRRSLVRV